MLPMDTPSTRKVTATIVAPEAALGAAVSTTIRFTIGAGAASVMEEAVAVVVVPVPVVPVPVVPVPVVPVPVVPVPVVLVPVVAVLAVLGVVMLSLPQPARTTDSAAMAHRTRSLEIIFLKALYIAYLPKTMSAASPQ